MADHAQDQDHEYTTDEDLRQAAQQRGCFSRLAGWLVFLAAVGLGFAFYEMSKPQDLTDIQGYRKQTRDILHRDIARLLRESREKEYPVTLTEREINTWLARKLSVKQGGMLAGEEKVSLDGVWVRLEEGRAEIVMERRVWGKPFTSSMYIQVVMEETEKKTRREILLHGGPFHEYLPFPHCGGRFGKMPMPQGFMVLTLPAYKNLAEACREELDLIEEHMNRITIGKGSITFDPRSPRSTVTELPF